MLIHHCGYQKVGPFLAQWTLLASLCWGPFPGTVDPSSITVLGTLPGTVDPSSITVLETLYGIVDPSSITMLGTLPGTVDPSSITVLGALPGTVDPSSITMLGTLSGTEDPSSITVLGALTANQTNHQFLSTFCIHNVSCLFGQLWANNFICVIYLYVCMLCKSARLAVSF